MQALPPNGEVLGLILLTAFGFLGALIFAYVVKIGYAMLQGLFDREDLPTKKPPIAISEDDQPPF